MEGYAPDRLIGFGLGERFVDALDDAILVVIPYENLHVAEPGVVERGAQMARCELGFFLRCEQARLPRLPRHGLVLHRHARNGYTLARVFGNVARHHGSPHAVVLLAQASPENHRTRRFHERRRTPGRCDDLDGRIDCKGALDKRNEQLPIVFDGEEG